MADEGIQEEPPEGVYWNAKETMFFNAKKQTMGSVFFDKWKDMRAAFPQSLQELGVVEQPEKPSVPRRHQNIENRIKAAPAVTSTAPNEMIALARRRKALFDAYMEVGFARDEALELCTKED